MTIIALNGNNAGRFSFLNSEIILFSKLRIKVDCYAYPQTTERFILNPIKYIRTDC